MQLRILKFPSGHSLTQLPRKKKSLFLFRTNVMGTLRAYLCGGDIKGMWREGGEGVKKGVRKETGGRERDAFYEVCFIGQFVGESQRPGHCCVERHYQGCLKDTNTSFIGSVFHFRESETAQNQCHTTKHRSVK